MDNWTKSVTELVGPSAEVDEITLSGVLSNLLKIIDVQLPGLARQYEISVEALIQTYGRDHVIVMIESIFMMKDHPLEDHFYEKMQSDLSMSLGQHPSSFSQRLQAHNNGICTLLADSNINPETALHLKLESHYWYMDSFFPIFSEKKAVVAVGAVVIEITKRKEAEIGLKIANEEFKQFNKELTQINKKLEIEIQHSAIANKKLLKSQQQQLIHALRVNTMGGMASGIAHELNQPLAAITNYAEGCCELMKRKDTDKVTVANSLKMISTEALRCGNIIKKLGNLMQSGKMRKETFDLKNVIEDATCLMRSDLREAKIDLDIKIGKHFPPVISDKTLLSQVLINLIKNAMEVIRNASVKVRKINIIVKLVDNTISIQVRDYGPGEPQKIMKDIFTPYCSTKKNNLGMGLAISRTILESLDGNLSLINQSGPGDCFEILIPMENRE